MKTISVRAGVARYEAIVGSCLLETIGVRAAQLFRGPACAVIADATTAALYAETIVPSLSAAGFKPVLVTIPVGENSKSLDQVGLVCAEMARGRLDRSSFVVALGGGVVGDLAGFVAAIYHRGIPYAQVPTTLLAQVDSSIGGKTGVNTAAGKNSLGAVHQPALVLADIETLKTLPAREMKQGFAEIIKHAIVADASLLEVLKDLDRTDLSELISRNIQIKADVVARDERELSGERAVLNFGHTVGHAIEKAGGYGGLLHGEAISLGIVAAGDVSVRKAGLPEADRDKIVAILQAFDLPIRLPPDFPREKILPALQADKKFERGEIRFVVTPRLGSAHLATDITLADIERALARL